MPIYHSVPARYMDVACVEGLPEGGSAHTGCLQRAGDKGAAIGRHPSTPVPPPGRGVYKVLMTEGKTDVFLRQSENKIGNPRVDDLANTIDETLKINS
jgi:hypothetical protein